MEVEESKNLVKQNQDKLLLIDKQYDKWSSKRYIVLIEVYNVEKV